MHRYFVLFLLLFCLAPLASGKQIYRWKDANGTLHFSDTPPPDRAATSELSARLIDVDPQAPVRLRTENYPGENRYFLYNDLSGPASVEISAESGAGIAFVPPLPTLLKVPSKREIPAFTARAEGPAGEYSISYRWTPGDPDAVPDPDALYQLPFRAGLKFEVHQGFNGSFSHSAPENQYAVDLALPLGTDVLAARAGVVMQVQDDFYRAGLDLDKFGERANMVIILHSDGTFAVYAHLDLESVKVGQGRRVEAGTLIGKSGNTGFSTGPHLHFVVQHNRAGKLHSVPFQFVQNGVAITPEAGMVLGNTY